MKTDNITPTDVIWSNNDDLLTDENCLPVIANSQITSILSNLDSSNEKSDPPVANPDQKHQNNYVVLKENTDKNAGSSKKSLSKPENGNFEDVLYFVCNLCPFLCTKNSKITEHLENAHKTKTVRKLPHLKCPACVNVFFHKMSLRSHLIHDHGVGNSDISLIVQAVVYYANKAKCQKSAKVDKPPAAIPLSSNDEESTEYPVMLVKAENPIKEQIMGKIMGKKKAQSCSLCKVTLQSVENMVYHLKCHKDSGFECPTCNEFFTSWKQLTAHLWRLHKVDMELYACDKCNYKSVSLAKLNNIHKLTHSEVRAFACPTCKKAFKNSKQLGNHKMMHKRELDKPKFTCDICSKNFTDRRQLRIHMNVVHEKIKPYLCNFCGYKGSSRSALKMHIRQHTGEKPFTCDSCSYATSDHNSLRRHKLRHTGQKPYKCSYCSYACIQSSTYKVHLKTKHPGQEKDLMFTCQECQFRSVNKEMYVAHMITVHDQKPQT